MNNSFPESTPQSTDEFTFETLGFKTEVKREDEALLTENISSYLIKLEPMENDDDHCDSIAKKNNSCTSTDLKTQDLKTDIHENVIKKELQNISVKEKGSALYIDTLIKLTEDPLKNKNENLSNEETFKKDTLQEDFGKFKELVETTGRNGYKNRDLNDKQEKQDILDRSNETQTVNGLEMDKRSYKCDLCDYKSLYKSNLKIHHRVHTKERPFPCKMCDKKFFAKQGLDRHIASRHSENKKMMKSITSKIIKCDICVYETASTSYHEEHVQNVDEHEQIIIPVTFQCDICGYNTTVKNYLKRHIQNHISVRHVQNNCQICNLPFLTKQNLNYHIVSIHSDNKKLMDTVTCKIKKCDSCDYKTVSSTCFKIHMQKHESPNAVETYQCDVCNYKTTFNKNLKRHVKIHTGVRRYVCKICDKKFFTKHNMDRHVVSMHSENKKLMDTVTNKIYKCNLCEYKTVSSTGIDVHLQRHKKVETERTSERTYQCDVCEYKTMIKDELKKHIQVHTSKDGFLCQICNKKLLTKRYLYRHIIFKHSENGEAAKRVTSQ